ncbi:MAG: Nif3-like dinuclear metal center hexameric protein [bacterium]
MNEVGIEWKSLSEALDTIIPPQLAEKWDNVGLQIDCNPKTIRRILLCLDVLLPVVEEAIDKKVDLIISHHPLIFSPIKKIDSTMEGGIIKKLIRAHISLFVMHTNLDKVAGGVNDVLCHRLGLEAIAPFGFSNEEEEPDLGRMGTYSPHKTLQEITDLIKHALSIPYVRVVGPLDKKIERVALCAGAGASFIDRASQNKAELLITADIKYHEAHKALAKDLTLIDIGHFNSEIIILPALSDKIRKIATHPKAKELEIFISQKETDPFLVL